MSKNQQRPFLFHSDRNEQKKGGYGKISGVFCGGIDYPDKPQSVFQLTKLQSPVSSQEITQKKPQQLDAEKRENGLRGNAKHLTLELNLIFWFDFF